MIHLGRMKQFVAGALALIMISSVGVEAYASTGADVSDVTNSINMESEEEIVEHSLDTKAAYEFSVTASVEKHNITLSWIPVEGIEYYRVYDETDKELSTEVMKPEIDETGKIKDTPLSFIISDKVCSVTPYKYVVRGYQTEVAGEESSAPEKKETLLYETEVTVKVGAELKAPIIQEARFTAKNQAKVSWKAAEHAYAYNVYRKVEGANWTLAGTTADTTYVDNAVALGKTYYTVQTVGECCGRVSNYDEKGTEAFYVKPVVISTVKSPNRSSVRVTWNAVSGATGYRVYMRIGEAGKWTAVGNTTKTNYSHSFKTKDWGKRIYFYVNSYCKEYTSLASPVRSTIFKPEKAVLKEVNARNYNTNKIYWEKMPGVDGYRVYRKKTGNKTWTCIKTLTGEDITSYLDKKATTGTTYDYTVKTYWKSGSKRQLGYYDTKGMSVKTTIETPKLVSAKTRGTQIEIRWEKVTGATGYAIYRKAENEKSWSRIDRVGGNSTVRYRDDAPKAGVKYNYRVKAYRKINGNYKYGETDKKGLNVTSKIGVQYYKVRDRKSALYGKTLKLHYDKNGKKIQNIHSLTGKKSKYYLYVNKHRQQVTAYYKEDGCYVPVRSMICSTGLIPSHTPNGTFRTPKKYRWRELNGPCWGQYCTRIVGSILFHSVFYRAKNDPTLLAYSPYNKLGKPASHGCIRLTVESAKWIYDNCKLGTSVTIHSKSGYEPLAKPTAYKVNKNHRWDPTDPGQKWRCKKRGCHDYAK